MKKHRADIIQMSIESKEASPGLVRPDLDLVVVASRNEQRLGFMEIDTSDRPIVLFEAVNQGSHTVIPQLDGRRV